MKNKLFLMKLAIIIVNISLQGMETEKSLQKFKNKSHQSKNYKKNSSEYPYLNSKVFQQRHQAAAKLIENCPMIVEIGGGISSMACHATQEQKLIIIDPVIKRKDDDRIVCIPKKFEDWNGLHDLQGQRYAVVILGLALNNMPDHGWKKLFEMIDTSERTVIEYSTTYRDAKQQLKSILKNVNKVIIFEQIFDFSQEEELKSYDKVNPYRKMICLGDK